MSKCPCGSKQRLDKCCEPILLGKRIAKTPEQLMRSRYSAYAMGHYEYVLNTYAAEPRAQLNVLELAQGNQETQWVHLDVVHTQGRQVEFKAYYRINDALFILHERSDFIKENGRWVYLTGQIITSGQLTV